MENLNFRADDVRPANRAAMALASGWRSLAAIKFKTFQRLRLCVYKYNYGFSSNRVYLNTHKLEGQDFAVPKLKCNFETPE